ncbi:hypothetical protein K505DRAFT_343518 [Melanomma pulvis-pyrius CBS 109.77]|uniref:BRCT domain-containing protein n=1 Tax=Melanomma pulvis-pyrius CBS 109.77 TaxID=1314802 RepID=A0A6A6WSJ8_9PLEO|nr:hypothetical protein K505DRAFT_343518 [Melanomma pulvis-pyrius CBS 109.77]
MDAIDGGYGTSQMPLAGAILCCTSISPEQRTELAAIGSQMGATIKLDLTSDVTHLIVGSINSAKYRYVAKAREDVKVLSPDWLEALRTVWMEGGDVDVAALEREYRLPAFFGLKICLTGFDNPDQRKFIQETVMQNGAEYHGDLTKTVTHLIAAIPAGKKYEHAVNWRMKIVSWEWFEESHQRGMALDENCYLPTMPVEERGKGAWDRKQNRPPTPLGKRTREAEPNQLANPLRRKLRRAASSRMGTQSEALWAGITAAGLEVAKNVQDDWVENNIAKRADSRECAATSNVPMVFHDDAQLAEDPASQPHQSLTLPANRNDGLFEGRVVFAHGFDDEKTNILQQHLHSNGATVIRKSAEIETFSSDDLTRGFLVVPHNAPVDLTLLPEGAGMMCLVTNWWVERCLHGKSLVNPANNVLCTPFDKLSISGFNDLTVNSTAFVGIELLHVTKIIALMGANYDEMLSAKTSVIVCNTRKPNPEKFKFATDKQIPAVHSTWLWDCLSTGKLQPFDRYLLNTIAPRPQKPHQKPQASFTVVPTAPLSEEDSAKLRNRKTKKSATTNPRGVPQQSRTLDLALSADPIPLSSTESSTVPNPSTRLSFLYQDESPPLDFDDGASFPLRDIHPSVNSPRRPSTSSDTSAGTLNKTNSVSTSRSNSTSDAPRKSAPAPRPSRLTKETSPDSVLPAIDPVIPTDDSIVPAEDSVITAYNPALPPENTVIPADPIPEQKDHASIMYSIMAARKAHAAAVTSKSGPITTKEDDKRKRRRQLGRATSTRSNPSTADDIVSRASSVAEGAKRGIIGEEIAEADEVDAGGEEGFNGKARNMYEAYQPSQELGWDAPGAQEVREQMIRAMGGKVEESGMLVASIGVVKDVVSEGGGGMSRAVRKRRG